jgi:hypothetical protein
MFLSIMLSGGILVAMTSDEKKRDAASEALISLRKALGKTQQTFAVEVLKTAIGTVAHYETSDPPRGDVLLRLGDIAASHGFEELKHKFQLLYLEGVQKSLGVQFTWIPPTGSQQARGYLNVPLSGNDALAGAQAFMGILRQLEAKDEETSNVAASALRALSTAWQKHRDPTVREVRDTKHDQDTGVPRPAKRKAKRSKARRTTIK